MASTQLVGANQPGCQPGFPCCDSAWKVNHKEQLHLLRPPPPPKKKKNTPIAMACVFSFLLGGVPFIHLNLPCHDKEMYNICKEWRPKKDG